VEAFHAVDLVGAPRPAAHREAGGR
jgi:hypothetical protein